MAFSRQDLMKLPGLSGTANQRQAQLYNRLGAPMGKYTGAYKQNMWMWDQVSKGNYGANKPKPKNPLGIPTPTARTPFSEVLPYDKVFNPATMQAFAESQVLPEVYRQRDLASQGLERGLAGSGNWRSGYGAQQRQGLSDQYSRMGQEQTQQFGDTIQGYTNDWYNKQYEQYYKNPSAYKMPTLPTYQDYANQNPGLASAYNAQNNTPTTYKNPFMF